MVSVSENHEEHLTMCYPKLQGEIEVLKASPAPASFKTTPGSVTGKKLGRAGIATTICLLCGAEIPVTRTLCNACAEDPKISGGGNSWLILKPAA
jgi:hypothetical protein